MPQAPITIRRVNYQHPADCAALITVLDSYARDPIGGGQPLGADTRARLCTELARLPHAASFIAWVGSSASASHATTAPDAAHAADAQPVGLLNSFEGFSTFKARPLLNVHDIAVLPAWRGQGIGQALLAAAETHARQRGCCKLTLEVLSGNTRALRSYTRFGFAPYTLDPADGQALLMQKWLENT